MPTQRRVVAFLLLAIVGCSLFYVVLLTADIPLREGDVDALQREKRELRINTVRHAQSRIADGRHHHHWHRPKTILVAIDSQPKNVRLRELQRKELLRAENVRLLFVIDTGGRLAPSSVLAKELHGESRVWRDMLILSTERNHTTFTPHQKLKVVLEAERQRGAVDFIITSTDTTLLFIDHIEAQLSALLRPTPAHRPYKGNRNHPSMKDHALGNPWHDICIIPIKKGGGGSQPHRLHPPAMLDRSVCSFAENTKPSTLYEWIAGRCEPAPVYYLRHAGPLEVIHLFGKRVFEELRRTHSHCRSDWQEIAGHNKVWYEMMKAWVDFANKYNIKWFLMSGPLIGAVRHQGFVPYDPDLDIMLLPESFEAAVRYLMQDEESLPFYINRRGHPYMPLDKKTQTFTVDLPKDYADIAPYFKPGCHEGCWDGGPLVAKLRHKRSCYGGAWSGGYVMDVFILPPQDMPRLQNCTIEGMTVPCPADVDAWLTREVESNWLVPQDEEYKVNVIKQSNPYKSCAELEQ